MSKKLIAALGEWPEWVAVRSHEPEHPCKFVLKSQLAGDTAANLALVLKNKLGKDYAVNWIQNKELKRTVAVITLTPERVKQILAPVNPKVAPPPKVEEPKSESKVVSSKTDSAVLARNPFADKPPDSSLYSPWPRKDPGPGDDTTKIRFSLIELH